MFLTIRTDKPEAEIGLYANDGSRVAYEVWLAHRQLADTLLGKIRDLLSSRQKGFSDISGVVVFKGPGSFTGLRIGVTVANAIAYAREIPVVGVMGQLWQEEGCKRLASGEDECIVIPEYGAEANITLPKK